MKAKFYTAYLLTLLGLLSSTAVFAAENPCNEWKLFLFDQTKDHNLIPQQENTDGTAQTTAANGSIFGAIYSNSDSKGTTGSMVKITQNGSDFGEISAVGQKTHNCTCYVSSYMTFPKNTYGGCVTVSSNGQTPSPCKCENYQGEITTTNETCFTPNSSHPPVIAYTICNH